jgi:hypothetical protein
VKRRKQSRGGRHCQSIACLYTRIEEGLAQADRGEFVAQEEMDAFFAAFGTEQAEDSERRTSA